MSSVAVAVGSLVAFALAYSLYSRFIASRLFEVRHDAITPATELQDGVDYVPTRASILFGHHFSSIAGAAPIVGPAIAVIWGWLPAVVWIVVGTVFVGAVHDMGSLILSARNKGRSIAEVAKTVVSARTRTLFFLIIFFALLVVMAVFALVISVLFIRFPASVLPILLQTPAAVALGLLIYKKKARPLLPSIAAVSFLYFSVWLGTLLPIKLPPLLLGSEIITWVAILMLYVYTASTLPVWVLLQPRDYVNSHLLLVALSLFYIGIFVLHPPISAPAINPSPQGAPCILPFLFITIACGAVSGFHALVSSGTTVKQLCRETDARPVAYGGMLAEGALAVVAALACTAGFASRAQWASHYTSWSAAGGFMTKITAFVSGAGRFLSALGIPAQMGTAIVSVTLIAFAATSLDTATRIQRYIISELATVVKVRALTGRHPATMLAVGLAFGLTIIKQGRGGMILWPLFGTINQLMAGLTFLVITVYLVRRNKPTLYTTIPMAFLLLFTSAALIINLQNFLAKNNWLLLAIGTAIAILEVWFIAEGIIAIRKSAQHNPP